MVTNPLLLPFRRNRDLMFSEIHIYEPVPDFYKQLEPRWDGYIKEYGWNAVVHKYGLGASDR